MFFWRFYKDKQTSDFGYFGYAWLDAHNMLSSTQRANLDVSLHVKNKLHFFTSSLRILRFDWSTAFRSISFRLFPGKTYHKIFQKIQKAYFGAILGNFCPNLEKNEFFLKKCSVSFLIFQLSTMVQKIREKFTDRQTDSQTDRKTDRQTDRQAEDSDFIGPSIEHGSRKSNLQNATLIEEEKIIANLILSSKLWYFGQICTILK